MIDNHDQVIADWFAYLKHQESKAEKLQHAAKLAKQGNTQAAKNIMQQVDSAPVVFDGSKLRDAVKALLKERDSLKAQLQNHDTL